MFTHAARDALDPIVINTNIVDTWIPVCLFGGLIVAYLGLTLVIVTVGGHMSDDERNMRITGVVMMAVGLPAVIAGAVIPTGSGPVSQGISDDAVVKAITEDYKIESITGTDALMESDEGNLIPVGSAIDRLRAPVSPKSPQLTGVADGQQISFKVGFTDCEEDPTPEIIVTDSPDQDITADDLKR